jgi:hypothetical protein
MSISPFKNKHQAMEAYRGVKYIELRCIKDGFLRRFNHDGPFPRDRDGKPVENWMKKNAQTGTANCLRQFKKKDHDPLGGPRGNDPNATINVYVWDKDETPPRIWDPRLGEYFEPVVMTEHHKKAMEAFVAQRNSIEVRANEQRAALKAAEEAKADAGLERMLGALADRMSKGGGKKAAAGAT